MLSVQGLSKKYGRRWIFRDLSFDLQLGDTLLVVGPNGSGKSTLLKVIAGLLPSSSGSVNLNGNDLGYAALDLSLYPHLTALEHLNLSAELKGIEPNSISLLERVSLESARDLLTYKMSTGMRMRLKLALAIQSQPQILMLDEPSASLDQDGRKLVERIVEEQRSRGIALIATNDPLERALGNMILDFGTEATT